MLEQAARDLDIDLTRSVLIGDQPTDMLAAQRVGALRIGVSNPLLEADHREPDLPAAVRWLTRCS